MALDGATLVARGSSAAGEQPNGIAAQYQLSGTNSAAVIHPPDTFSQVTAGGPVLHIIGTVPPGKPGLVQRSGVIQNATDLICNSNPLGNTLTSTASQVTPGLDGSGVPTVNPAQLASAGLSLAPEHE
jgi:hypothetical protein